MPGQHTFDLLIRKMTERLRNPDAYAVKGDLSNQFKLSYASLARLNALAECLDIQADKLLQELVAAAMGDAHDGFLAAFDDPEQKEQANQKLKLRVKALLDEFENS